MGLETHFSIDGERDPDIGLREFVSRIVSRFRLMHDVHFDISVSLRT